MSTSPSRRSFEPNSQSLDKSTSKRHSSPIKRSNDAPTKQSSLHKTPSDRSSSSRSPSPFKQGYDSSSQSLFHKSERSSYFVSNRSSCNRSPSPLKWDYNPTSQSLFRSERSNCSESNRSSGNQSSSPLKRGYDLSAPPLRSEQSNSSKSERGRTTTHKTASDSRIESVSYAGKSTNISTVGSWRGSAHSLHSPPTSQNSSPSRKSRESKLAGVQKSAHVSWSTGDRRQDQDKRSASRRNRSPSPSMRNHTSSQSSIDSVMSSGSSGLNREEYVIMADLPKGKRVLQRSRPNQMEGIEKGNRDETSLYKPARY